VRMCWVIAVLLISPYMRFYREAHSKQSQIWGLFRKSWFESDWLLTISLSGCFPNSQIQSCCSYHNQLNQNPQCLPQFFMMLFSNLIDCFVHGCFPLKFYSDSSLRDGGRLSFFWHKDFWRYSSPSWMFDALFLFCQSVVFPKSLHYTGNPNMLSHHSTAYFSTRLGSGLPSPPRQHDFSCYAHVVELVAFARSWLGIGLRWEEWVLGKAERGVCWIMVDKLNTISIFLWCG
jgi:hypothetical protein